MQFKFHQSLFFMLLLSLVACMSASCFSGGDDDDDDNNDDDDATGGFTCTENICLDSSSGLMWMNLYEDDLNWADAVSFCEGLGLEGHHDWHLPTVGELRSLIRGCDFTESDGSCNVTDDCLEYECGNETCYGCQLGMGPGMEGCYWPSDMADVDIEEHGLWFWSSSPVEDYAGNYWRVHFGYGHIGFVEGSQSFNLRCVRDQ